MLDPMCNQSRENDIEHLQILTLNEALHGPFGFSPIFSRFWFKVRLHNILRNLGFCIHLYPESCDPE